MRDEIVKTGTGSMGDNRLAGLPIDRNILFSNFKGDYKKRIEKKQTRLFKKIGFIKPFLEDGEKIRLVTTGCSPGSFIEQWTTGAMYYYLKRALFIFTDRRFFHVPTKSNYTYRNSIAQIYYTDCSKLMMKGSALKVEYLNGKKDSFLAIGFSERKKLKFMLKDIPLNSGKVTKPGKAAGKVHLCPACRAALETDMFTCRKCRLAFKDKATAKKLSIIFPGGGYFYTGHFFLGISDAFTETVLIIFVLVGLVGVFQGDSDGIALFCLFGLLLIIEKLITVYHAEHYIKEFLPKKN